MTELKTCWTCRLREQDASLPPCSICEDTNHDFTEYTKWEPRNKKDWLPEWMKNGDNDRIL